MKKAIIGIFFKNYREALKRMNLKNKNWGKDIFRVLTFENGYLVVSEGQLKEMERQKTLL